MHSAVIRSNMVVMYNTLIFCKKYLSSSDFKDFLYISTLKASTTTAANGIIIIIIVLYNQE